MGDLEAQLRGASGARFRLIATDGVFSMDGIIANLTAICDLADQYQALVMVDDSHAVGFVGAKGKGHARALRRAWAGSTSSPARWARRSAARPAATPPARKEIVAWLRQRSRPYLFSNTLMPAICAATLTVLDLLEGERRAARAAAGQRRALPGRDDQAGLQARRGEPPDHPGDARATPSSPRPSPTRCWPRGSTSSASATRWCRRARRASAPRCPRRTPASSSTGPSPPSPRSAAPWG